MIQPQEHRRKETQGQWSRLLWLDRAIRDQRYPNVHHLQDEFGVSRRTAFHTVGFLRGSLGAPVRYSKRRGGYYYEDPTYGLPTVFLQEGELLALLLAEQVTNQYLGTPMEAPLRAAVGKITRYLPEEVRVELSEVADIFRFGGASSMEVPLGLMLGVQRAIRERRVLRILYYTASRDETRERDVDPHFLTNVRGDWMLVAWDHWRERDAVFMLARIQEFQMLERVFSRRPELNPQHYSQHTFLTEHGAEPYEVVLRFDSYQARWIRERRWHPGQQVKEQEDGGLILRMTVAGVGDLTRWILGYGSHVEVLAPDWLRGDVASECGRAARIYRDHQHYKDMDEERLLRIWAKTDKQDETAYHPLLFHLLDVAAVARSLWDLWLPAELKLRVGAALGLDEEQARVAVVILAGMHDLGKACPAFQRQVGRLFERLGLPDTDFPSLRPLHGFVSAKELIDRYGKSGLGWRAGTEAAYCLAAITGGHHGVFPGPDHLGRLQYKVAAGSEEKWTHARERLIQEFLSAAAGEAFAAREVQTPEIRDPGIVPILAGLISVADWIGSAQEYFRPAARIDAQVPVVGTYVSDLPKTARKALKGFGWLPNPIAAPPAPINEVFRYIENFDANRMQRTVAQIAESHSEPYLLIVEEAMGRGKSEAAMYAFDRAFSERRTHGLYVALPTMATGNAMFGRVRRYLEERKHGGRLNLQLIYGNALLHEEFAELVFGSVYQEGGDPQHAATAQTAAAEGTVSAAAWFTARKRPLLAPFGVGTIDQSLLGVLQTRHWFVRLFGLAGKVVVFDEIHSYDVYMLTELKLLIRWLRELRCTVILLSATLPSDRRRELVKAWGAAPPFEHKPYPRVTVASEGTAREEHVGEPSDLDRRVGLEFALPEPAGLPNLVRKHLPRGGCGVIICNTVDRAQEVYRTLRDVFKPEGRRVLLFHARMPLAWREKREERVRQLLGKKGDRSQPTLIVGSQVLEQSLDYDADWMASDIADI
jgi:CRISPR-associated endonuclease/helicase Cas3